MRGGARRQGVEGIKIGNCKADPPGGVYVAGLVDKVRGGRSNRARPCSARFTPGLYTILPLPIMCGIYYNNGGSGERIVLRNSMGDDEGGGCLNKGRVRKELY